MEPALYQWAYMRGRPYLLSILSHGVICARCKRKAYK